MSACDVCRKRAGKRKLHHRLAIPEYRSMIGFWPWVTLQVCDQCLAAHDRDFRERVALLAPSIIEDDEPVVRQVCLACGAAETDTAWHEASKWVDAHGKPVRRARFYLCGEHAGRAYVDGIIVSSALADGEHMAEVLGELPAAGADLIKRVERWDPAARQGPEGALDFAAGRNRRETLAGTMRFWTESPAGLEAKAAWMGPIRRDYRLRYRLDLVRDTADGRRETFTVIRTGPEEFATYRTAAAAPKPPR